MNDLRSLEGLGQLLSQKLGENNRYKLRTRQRTNSGPSINSRSSSISSNNRTPIFEYFPPKIAHLLGTNIENGYYSSIQHSSSSEIPFLYKAHSDFLRRDDLSIDDNDNNDDDDDGYDFNEYQNYNKEECVTINNINKNDDNYYIESDRDITPPIMNEIDHLSLVPSLHLAPVIIPQSFSTEINDSNSGLTINLDCDYNLAIIDDDDNEYKLDIIDDDGIKPIKPSFDGYYDDDDIECINLKNDYMEYRLNSNKNAFNNIGNGASGIVRKAFHYKSCKMVAIKQCRSKQQHELNSFIKENKLYNKFKLNPNIINVSEFGRDIQDDGDLMMALEYMDLGSTDSIKIHQIYEIQQRELIVAHIMLNVLNGLNDLHQNLYIHNDIKPANILCNKYGQIKLSDFGTVSKLENKGNYLTKNCGTQKYQSPEKLCGKLESCKFNTKADVWSIGVSCYELLFGAIHDNNEYSYIDLFRDRRNLLTPETHKLSANCCDFMNKCLIFDDDERPSIGQLLQHKWFTDIKCVELKDKWPWYQSINNLNEINDEKLQRQQEEKRNDGDLKENEYDNQDLLFMISALIIYYSTQNVNFSQENGINYNLYRRITHWNQDGPNFSDNERISNIAHYALCSKNMVIERIRVTVGYIKSQLNKAKVSRMES